MLHYEVDKSLLWHETENISLSTKSHQYLLDREKDLEGLWFLSRERDLSLLLSLEKDLQKPNHPITQQLYTLIMFAW